METVNAARDLSVYKSTHQQARLTTTAIGLFVAIETVATLLQVVDRLVFPDEQLRVESDSIATLAFSLVNGWAAISCLVALVLSVVSFLAWLYRSSCNLDPLARQLLRTTPRMAVACWFIPIVNLVRPYRVVKALYRANEPSTNQVPGDWIARVPAILPIWWTAWLVSQFLSQTSARLSWFTTPERAKLSLWFDVAAVPFDLIAAACVAAVVWSIEARQKVLAQEGASDREAT